LNSQKRSHQEGCTTFYNCSAVFFNYSRQILPRWRFLPNWKGCSVRQLPDSGRGLAIPRENDGEWTNALYSNQPKSVCRRHPHEKISGWNNKRPWNKFRVTVCCVEAKTEAQDDSVMFPWGWLCHELISSGESFGHYLLFHNNIFYKELLQVSPGFQALALVWTLCELRAFLVCFVVKGLTTEASKKPRRAWRYEKWKKSQITKSK